MHTGKVADFLSSLQGLAGRGAQWSNGAMENLLNFWQHIPEHLRPDVFSIGVFSIHWYSLMYIVALLVIFLLTAGRIKKGEVSLPSSPSELLDVITWSVLGIIAGGRLGYVLIYDPRYYASHTLEAFLPFSWEGGFHYTGFLGMSFHGGLVGVLVVFFLYCRKRGWKLFDLTDVLAPAIPLGYTFGRLGNFINGELYGRATHNVLGMYFPLDPSGVLRYPSQLIEALLEGLLLFAVLWPLRNRRPFTGFLSGFFLIGYGVFRFIAEFFRQPDPQLGFVLWGFSMGQLLCAAMVVSGIIIWMVCPKREKARNQS